MANGLSVVYVRNDASGKVHRRVRTSAGKLMSIESCNADDTVAITFVTDLRTVALADLCKHCFSPTDAGAVLAASEAQDEPLDDVDPEDAA